MSGWMRIRVLERKSNSCKYFIYTEDWHHDLTVYISHIKLQNDGGKRKVYGISSFLFSSSVASLLKLSFPFLHVPLLSSMHPFIHSSLCINFLVSSFFLLHTFFSPFLPNTPSFSPSQLSLSPLSSSFSPLVPSQQPATPLPPLPFRSLPATCNLAEMQVKLCVKWTQGKDNTCVWQGWLSERASEQASEWVCEWESDWISVCESDLASEWVRKWMAKCERDIYIKWVSEWVFGWVC